MSLLLSSICFELLIPVTLTTTVFWTIIAPKAIKQTKILSKMVVDAIDIPPCHPLLRYSLDNLIATRAGMMSSPGIDVRNYVLTANIMVIVIIALISIAVPALLRVPLEDVFSTLLEILAIYAIVALGEIYFIRVVAFNYAPETKASAFNQIMATMSSACLDVPYISPPTSSSTSACI